MGALAFVAGQGMAAGAVAAAYDAVSGGYDEQVRREDVTRRRLWRRYDRLFGTGMRVLDAGCGTGIDALHLAGRGVAVTAIDVSLGMLARLREKAAAAGLGGRIATRVADLGALSDLAGEPFDGVIAAFAALNTLPDLAPFGAAAADLLRPGGRMVVHMLNGGRRWGWRGWRGTEAGGSAERVVVIGGQAVRHYVWGAEEAYRRFFAAQFELVAQYGTGVFYPRPGRRLPGATRLWRALDHVVGGWGLWRDAGAFFVLDLARRVT